MSISDTPHTTIEASRSSLEAVIDDLRADGRLTGDDAAELVHRVDSLAADLAACVGTDTGTNGATR